MKPVERFLNIEYMFERRKYSGMKFFTWLLYRQVGSQTWESYGDPWPKSRLNRNELHDALCAVVVRNTKPGTTVRTVLGNGVIIEGPTQPGCLKADIEEYAKNMPLHPNSIVEIMH